ncbi:MAG: hypothetical protein ACLRIS_08785 [Flavonifractor plautii]
MLGWTAHPPARRGGVAVSIRLRHACDSFQLTCLWEPDSGNDLAEAVSFGGGERGTALHRRGGRVRAGLGHRGGTYRGGPGMAARLLDNEALGADYQVATVEDILRDHVAPTALRPCGGGAAAGAGLLGGRGEQRVAGGL